MSFETSSQDQTILHFSLATTPQLFHHFERTPFASIGDPSAYFAAIVIMPCCILFKDRIPLNWLFLGHCCFSSITKSFPLDLEEIIGGNIDVEGDSTKKVERVIHSI
jgi:hypothetical protein